MPEFLDEKLFGELYRLITEQQRVINSIADKLEQLNSFGSGCECDPDAMSGGNAVIVDFEEDQQYVRNTLVVDTATETVYRVSLDTNEDGSPYISTSVQQDCSTGHLKLVGFESQIVTFDHPPTQEEINTIPDDSLVAVYSTTDVPYIPSSQSGGVTPSEPDEVGDTEVGD